MAKTRQPLQIGMRMLAAFALLFLSFAHQPAVARQLPPLSAADYVLPDGTIAEICFGRDGLSRDDSHGRRHEGPSPVCQACRLSGAALIPQPADNSYLVVCAVVQLAAVLNIEGLLFAYPHLRPPSHGPPLLI